MRSAQRARMKRIVVRLPPAMLEALARVVEAISAADLERASRAAVARFYLDAAMTGAEGKPAASLGPFLARLDRLARGDAEGKKKRVVLRMRPAMVARLDALRAASAADPDAPTKRAALVRALFAVRFTQQAQAPERDRARSLPG